MRVSLRSPPLVYAVALAALGMALLLRWALDPWLSDAVPFVTLFGAVALAVWLGGALPAIVVAVLGFFAADALFVAPRGEIPVVALTDVIAAFGYALSCGLIIAFGAGMRSASRRAEAAREQTAGSAQQRDAMRQEADRLLARLETVIERSPLAVVEWRNSTIRRWSGRAEAMFGWSAAEVLGKGYEELPLVCEEDRDVAARAAAELQAGSKYVTVRIRSRAKDGHIVHGEWHNSAIVEGERVRGVVSMVLDVTDRVAAEDALRRSEAEHARGRAFVERLLDNLPVCICVLDSRDWRVLAVNAASQAIPGAGVQIVGRRFADVLAGFAPEKAIAIMKSVAASGQPLRLRDYFAPIPGKPKTWWDAEVIPLPDAEGRIESVLVLALDTTEKVLARQSLEKALASLRESEQLYRTTFELSTVGQAEVDPDSGRYVRVNAKFCEIVGYGAEELAGMTIAQLTHPDDVQAEQARFRSLVDGSCDEFNVEKRYVRKDGAVVWVDLTAAALRDAERKRVRVIGSIYDITARRRAEEALRDADRRKDEFLATLAHELRNPLSPIRSAVGILQLTNTSDPHVRTARDIIDRQVRHLTRLVDDLLDVSRITRGKVDLARERVMLHELMQEAIEATRPAVEAARVDFSVEFPPYPVAIEGDRTRLAQVLQNLIHNAAKFTPPGGTVRVRAAVEGAELLLSVRDTGAGMPPEQIPRLFRMFSQLESPVARTHGGLGIGLALVRGLVELHGGSVAAHSEGLGTGSTFVVRLPIVVARELQRMPPGAEANENMGTNPMRVLVADDNRDAADSLARMLRLLGHDVHAVYDGHEALVSARALRPQAMLLDIGMPKMSGYEVARRTRAESWGRDVLLVAITGWGQEDDKRRAAESGFDRHLTKPVDLLELQKVLMSSGSVTQ